MAGELDGGVSILKDRILIGLIPGPDLEYALDLLDMDPHEKWHAPDRSITAVTNVYEDPICSLLKNGLSVGIG